MVRSRGPVVSESYPQRGREQHHGEDEYWNKQVSRRTQVAAQRMRITAGSDITSPLLGGDAAVRSKCVAEDD